MGAEPVLLGDPAPWFSAETLAGTLLDLHVDAGRWVVLAFAGAPDDPRATAELAPLLAAATPGADDHLVVLVIYSTMPRDPASLALHAGPGLAVIADRDGGIAALYGASGSPRTIVLDPMLRIVANIGWDHAAGHAQTVQKLLQSLPEVDQSCGVPLTAPALIVPRVLDFALCDLLVGLYDQVGGEDSGFLRDRDGRTATFIDHRLKQRRDLVIAVPEVRHAIADQIRRRLLPAIARYFQFAVTRMDRYIISCYDAATGGHFFRHRDNLNAGAEHRRFAASINLNGDYDGCDLVFPEFGRRPYRAPAGGAIVFSCGALHEVTPIRRGRRYAFLPFLYGDADAALRTRNNERLAAGEAPYRADGHDLLTPAAAGD
ncbi:MAG TPA: 2OG-Fe(II) oxygenase [Stellaceae bacterium]|nr:2OG-Fe(II) oxygenase [Stellaceae bacterium]